MAVRLTRLAALALAAAALSCGGDDLTLPNEGQPAEIRAVRGNGQNGTIGEPLADSLVVLVADRRGNPVPGVEVTWTAEDGGSVDPVVDTTGADGHAGTRRTLGAQPGTYTTIATTPELPESPVVFTTTAVAARLTLATQPSAAAAVGAVFERQPVIQLLNESGNPIGRAGVVVTVQIATGGGALDGTISRPSDGDGRAVFTDLSIRGSPGVRTLIFAADGFASATSGPVAVGVGAAASMELAAGDDQTATVNTAVPVAPAVLLRDLDGNPVPGVPVHFSVTAGGGAVTGGTPVTDAQGVARVGSWRLGTAAGDNALRAQVQGAELAGSPVEFTATGTAGAVSAAGSTIEAAPGTIAASAGSGGSTITVTARDEFGNPVAGRTVTLATTGSGTLTQPAQPTDGAGAAAGRLTATVAGTYTVTAQIDGVALDASATVTVSAGPPSAGNSSASAGDGVAGTPTPIAVQLQDQFGNPVAGQAARISAGVTGANTANVVGQAEDQGGGGYVIRYTPITAGADQIQVRVDGAAIGGVISSTVSPGAASPATTTAQVPSSWRLFSNPGPIPVRVTVRDAHDNVRAGLTDAVQVQVDGASPPIQATPNGDGTYSAFFDPPRLGQVPVVITVNGESIEGSPFIVNISFF